MLPIILFTLMKICTVKNYISEEKEIKNIGGLYLYFTFFFFLFPFGYLSGVPEWLASHFHLPSFDTHYLNCTQNSQNHRQGKTETQKMRTPRYNIYILAFNLLCRLTEGQCFVLKSDNTLLWGLTITLIMI